MNFVGFSRVARDEIDPILFPLGFRRTPKMTGASWARQQDDEWLLVYLQSSSANGPGFPAYRFTAEISIGERPVHFQGRRRKRLYSLFTRQQREELRAIENDVIAKLPRPSGELVNSLTGDALEAYLSHWTPHDRPYPDNVDIWFRYCDDEDVQLLMRFLGRVLPNVIQRFLWSITLSPEAERQWFLDLLSGAETDGNQA